MSVSTIKHPATTLGKKQLQNIKKSSKNDAPSQLKAGFSLLRSYCRDNFIPRPLCIVDIGSFGSGRGHEEFSGDAMQTYAQTLMFIATGNKKHAEKALMIMDAWYCGCLVFRGSNAPLEIAWGSNCFVRACELLKYTYSGWDSKFETRMNKLIEKICLPNLLQRYDEIRRWKNNWILTITEALIQIALFKNDHNNFEKYIEEYKKNVVACVPHTSGKCTETTRDIIHAQFQIGSIVQICEMALQQGIKDLYAFENKLVKRTMEYHASILLGNVPQDVKKDELKDVWFLPSVWEIGFNHFGIRQKNKMPFTKELLQKKRPERASFNWGPSWMFYTSD
jgi:hypothetical protein